MAVTGIPSKSRKSNMQMSQMNGDFLTNLKQPLTSEYSRDIIGSNASSNCELKKKVDQWYREQNVALGRIRKSQEVAYRSLLNAHRDKKRIHRNNVLKRLKEKQDASSKNGTVIDAQILKIEHKENKNVKATKKKDVNDLAATFKAHGRAPSLGDEKVEKWLHDHIAAKDGALNKTDIVLPLSSQPIKSLAESPEEKDMEAINEVLNANKAKKANIDNVKKSNKTVTDTSISDKIRDYATTDTGNAKQKGQSGNTSRAARVIEVSHEGPKTVMTGQNTGGAQISKGVRSVYISSGQGKENKVVNVDKDSVLVTTEKHRQCDSVKSPKKKELKLDQNEDNTVGEQVDALHSGRRKEKKLRALPAINENGDESAVKENAESETVKASNKKVHKDKLNKSDHSVKGKASYSTSKYQALPPLNTREIQNSESLSSKQTDKKLSFVSNTLACSGSNSSGDQTARTKGSKKTGTVPLSMVEYNRERKKQKQAYRKSLLDSEEVSIYTKDKHGNIVASELSFKRSEFSLPSRRDDRIRERLLQATKEAIGQEREKMDKFFEKISKEGEYFFLLV